MSSNKTPLSVVNWLTNLRGSYSHEVLSTLQTKPITIEAARSLHLTSSTAAQMIRQIQSKVMSIQSEFDCLERVLESLENGEEATVAPLVKSLTGNVIVFIEKQKSRNIFYAETDGELKKFEENITVVLEMANDLRRNLSDVDYEVDMIREDIILLKRYILFTIRQIFSKLIKVIVHSIEDGKCDLMLRSNLSTLSMISNIDYNGFASLNDAFSSNETVRVLLMICIESKQNSIRALALRALATVCATIEAIRQFEVAGGIDILKDIMIDEDNRSEPELREAVSVLTQLTAPWHGPSHKIEGLRECIEPLVEAITGELYIFLLLKLLQIRSFELRLYITLLFLVPFRFNRPYNMLSNVVTLCSVS